MSVPADSSVQCWSVEMRRLSGVIGNAGIAMIFGSSRIVFVSVDLVAQAPPAGPTAELLVEGNATSLTSEAEARSSKLDPAP